jgi:phosphopantetheinyl transferase (holo-ACP synthase)
VPRVISCVRPLPVISFGGATAAVTRLSTPLHQTPSLSTFCTAALADFSASAAQRFFDAAAELHPRHQVPYVLSRVAASAAIARLPGCREGAADNVVFTGSRRSATVLHGCELSLSHEDCVGAAVAWMSDAPLPCSAISTVQADHSAADPRGSANESATREPVQRDSHVVCAIDVCPIAEVHRVRCRFPQLGQRWMPQCAPYASASIVADTLRTIEEPSSTQLRAGSPFSSHDGSKKDEEVAEALSRRREWWRQLGTDDTSQSEAYGSLVLAQHWSARECAVKLLGVSGRAFPYGCLQGDARAAGKKTGESALPFPTSFFSPHTLYCGVVGGCEAAVWRREGRDPIICFYSWVEWCPHSAAVDMPYVVVAACCSTCVPLNILQEKPPPKGSASPLI